MGGARKINKKMELEENLSVRKGITKKARKRRGKSDGVRKRG